ncbi:MAG TPA: hypothetical protein DFR83_06375 [Deltaproteobacteria bacterium]|nr:hypothetical protein [Deltaproteobacteria bacterium]
MSPTPGLRFPFHRHHAVWKAVASATAPGEVAHDLQHVLRVYMWCLKLAPEAGADQDLAGAAGLVHDLVRIPKHLAERPLGGARSAAAAEGLLPEAGYTRAEIGVVVDAVATHSWSRGLAPRSPEGMVLQDADRLDAIGAIGALRNAAVAQAMAAAEPIVDGVPRAFAHPSDPLALADRPWNDGVWALDHWRVKLLKLSSGMHLPSARKEARRRHQWMVAMLGQLQSELDAADSTRNIG